MKGTRLLSRRQLNGYFAALGLSQPAVGTITAALSGAPALAADVTSNSPGRTVKFPDNTIVPALGQGSARLAQGRHPESAEEEALRTGLSLGMTLIDTAEIYGNGNAERLIGHVIAGQRDRVFLVSKVWPTHVAGNGIERACEASLARLNTDHLDLYLLHWPNGITEFSGVVKAFENLRSARKIRAWGVSNFEVRDIAKPFACSQWRSLRHQSGSWH
jgi:diketogulonate reductase-like aldo/keto reductase